MSMKTPPSVRKSKRDPSAMLGRLTWMQVAMGRHFGETTEEIAAKVRKAISSAMADEWGYKEIEIDGVMEPVIDGAGMFRLAVNEFNLDTNNRFERDTWTGVVERALADALAHEGSFGPDGFEQREGR